MPVIPDTTDFLESLCDQLMRELASLPGVGVYCNLIRGHIVDYYVLSLHNGKTIIKAYIYSDGDAEFIAGATDRRFEVWDYKSLDEMKTAFVSEIIEKLTGGAR